VPGVRRSARAAPVQLRRVKLLYDENLSPRLVQALAGEYPDSAHVRDVGLRGSPDSSVWDFAQAHGFAIASKDTDFRDRSIVEGPPPKVIRLDIGNAGTAMIVDLLRRERQRVEDFDTQTEASLLILSIGAQSI
jgi:predicted nuclease of predicted toxin-antitoxin system